MRTTPVKYLVGRKRNYSAYTLFSNYTDAELTSFAQAVVAAQTKLMAAKTALATLMANQATDTTCKSGLNIKFLTYDKYIYYDSTSADINGYRHFVIGRLSGATFIPFTDEKITVNGDTNMYSLNFFTTRLLAYPQKISAKKAEIEQLQKDFDAANQTYQTALATLSPQQKADLEKQKALLESQMKVDNAKGALLYVGVGLAAIAAIIAVIYGYKHYVKSNK